MKLTFIGAAHEVTGSMHHLEACGRNILIDCGMQQGPDIYENQELKVPASQIDFVLLTHAHIDHSGLLPLLYKNGFGGSIYATDASCDLCSIMLRDSAHIQMFEAEWRNRKSKRSGAAMYEPLYDMDDAEGAIKLMVPLRYGQKVKLCDGIEVRFNDVGHLLGSAAIEVFITEGGVSKKLLFSGDVGNLNQPIIRDPQPVKGVDYVIIESTYGDRSHGPTPDYVSEFYEILKETFERGGNVVVPSFAVGRTQEILYFVRQIKAEKRLGDFDVYVDSPLAIEATRIFNENVAECFDEAAMALIKKGINPISFDGLKTTVTSDESKLINEDTRPKLILSASGMCEAGRIRHHLKHNLWRPECTILFVGYQAAGTLGRALVDGVKSVKLFGETIEVRAQIKQLRGISGHADREGLISWLGAVGAPVERVCVVHGESDVVDSFCGTIKEKLGFDTFAPYSGGCIDLATNRVLDPGARIIKAKPASKVSMLFDLLLEAGHRLIEVIMKNRDTTNKNIKKFTRDINELADKYDR